MLGWLLALACELKSHATLLELEATRRSTPHIISDVLLDFNGGLVPPDAFRVVPLVHSEWVTVHLESKRRSRTEPTQRGSKAAGLTAFVVLGSAKK